MTINISFARMQELVGGKLADELRRRSLAIYNRGAEHARSAAASSSPTRNSNGARLDGRVILIDEVLTPDSSRFWPADAIHAGPRASHRSTSNSSATGWNRPLGQEQPPAAAAGRRGAADAGEIYRGLRAADGAGVRVEVGALG